MKKLNLRELVDYHVKIFRKTNLTSSRLLITATDQTHLFSKLCITMIHQELATSFKIRS